MHRCPGCRGEVKMRQENPSFPFCSPRCRAVDLGKWFIGSYRVPGPPAPDNTAAQEAGRQEDDEQ